ncbi:hypothetical protein QL285_089308 [Trifolium repens]|jgi:hypothetical protein|nr:hypothetical protein QL285_089308 [Trifolium repens]
MVTDDATEEYTVVGDAEAGYAEVGNTTVGYADETAVGYVAIGAARCRSGTLDSRRHNWISVLSLFFLLHSYVFISFYSFCLCFCDGY